MIFNKCKRLTLSTLPILLSLIALDSVAAHGSWYMTEPGTACRTAVPHIAPGDAHFNVGGIFNPHSESKIHVSCPITLAGRQQESSNLSNPNNLHAKALYASIIVNDMHPSEDFVCTPVASMESGLTYKGRTVRSRGTGVQTLVFADSRDTQDDGTPPPINWGGQLAMHENEVIKSLRYDCTIPSKKNIVDHSQIISFTAQTCRVTSGCRGDIGTNNNPVLFGKVRVAPADCVPASKNIHASLERVGWVARGGTVPIMCPVRPPADDSAVHVRKITAGTIYVQDQLGSDANRFCVLTNIAANGVSDFNKVITEFDRLGRSILTAPITFSSSHTATTLYCFLGDGQNFQGAEFTVTKTAQNNGAF